MFTEENRTLEESVKVANHKLLLGGSVLVFHYDLSGFNLWGQELLKRGQEAYEDVMGGGRRVLAKLVTSIGGAVRADSGLHDVVDVLVQLPQDPNPAQRNALSTLLADYPAAMRDNPRGPKARLAEYGINYDPDPLLIVTADPAAYKHRINISRMSRMLGSNVPIPGMEGPAVKRSIDIRNYLRRHRESLQERLFIDNDSAKHLFELATGKILGPAELKELLSEQHLQIGHPPTVGKEPDTFAIYPLTLAQPKIHNFREHVYKKFRQVTDNDIELEKAIAKTVDSTFGSEKMIVRDFFETELWFDKESYDLFLRKIIKTATDFYKGCLHPPAAVRLSRGDLDQLQLNLLKHYQGLYVAQGYRSKMAEENAKKEVERLIPELPLRKLESFETGEVYAGWEYVLRPGEQALMGTIGRDVYCAAVVLALTGVTMAPTEHTIDAWTNRVAALQQQQMSGTAIHDYLTRTNDDADYAHSDRLDKNDLFEVLLQEALLRTHEELRSKHKRSIFPGNREFNYFVKNVMTRYVIETSLLHHTSTIELRPLEY